MKRVTVRFDKHEARALKWMNAVFKTTDGELLKLAFEQLFVATEELQEKAMAEGKDLTNENPV